MEIPSHTQTALFGNTKMMKKEQTTVISIAFPAPPLHPLEKTSTRTPHVENLGLESVLRGRWLSTMWDAALTGPGSPSSQKINAITLLPFATFIDSDER